MMKLIFLLTLNMLKLGITEWINTWVKNNWKTSKKEDVKNKDLWIELI